MEDRLRRLAAAFPVLILTGARQTGKTALLKRLFPDRHYVSLDLQLLTEQAEEAPASFLRDHPAPLVTGRRQKLVGRSLVRLRAARTAVHQGRCRSDAARGLEQEHPGSFCEFGGVRDTSP